VTGLRTGRRRGGPGATPAPVRKTNYRQLRNPFAPQDLWTADEAEAVHQSALRVLEDLGIRVLLPEARQLFRAAGARVDEPGQMVWIGREIVEAAIASAPASIPLIAGHPDRNLLMEPGSMIFQPGAGAPHASDLVRGRRPGSLRDYTELTKLTHHFDVLHVLPPLVEPQDVPNHLRHYAYMRTQLTLSDKFPFVYARGTPQVREGFEMLAAFRGLSDAAFADAVHCYTIINTNSPRQIDIPMAQGLLDFARAGQVSIVTPFTLMGAMAPITVAGALTLSHAEAMAAITLTQLARPGAPVCYGTFTSNVDMKSGAPALGTPEAFKANLGAGQLARRLGLPWRSAAGSAANLNDVQAAHETQMGIWGCVQAGATVTIHAAGWLEGGLTVSYEKLVTDVEVLQTIAELCTPTPAGEAEIGLSALREVEPGGHFFGAAHTMERYQTAFYEPVVADFANFGTWTERGGLDANTRATAIWQRILHEFEPPPMDGNRVEALNAYIAARSAAGGALPES
jgi:trimethylamine--corrinoid protein Co-methyltransferase